MLVSFLKSFFMFSDDNSRAYVKVFHCTFIHQYLSFTALNAVNVMNSVYKPRFVSHWKNHCEKNFQYIFLSSQYLWNMMTIVVVKFFFIFWSLYYLADSNNQVIFVFNSFIFSPFFNRNSDSTRTFTRFLICVILGTNVKLSDRIINSVVQIWELVVPKKHRVIQNLRI